LGVSRQAGAAELKQAYRRLAVHWHPDRNPGSCLAEERFKAVAEAYAVLSNPVKRRKYDLLGPQEFKNEYSQEEIFQGFEPGDFFKSFGLEEAGAVLTRIFGGDAKASPPTTVDSKARISEFFAGFGGKRSLRDQRAQDINVTLMVTFREAALGAEKFVAYNTPGGVVKVPVAVPPGAVQGQRHILTGQGPARPGFEPGDVVVTFNISSDPLFARRGRDLLTSLELSAREAAAGARPLVTALTGQSLRLTVPPGARAGAIFKIAGYGLPGPDGSPGDLLVQLKLRG
ncbi:MAG: DnaJ domain-containing protein, partial [Candidatus Adiutrix sp.]|jgi:curved DNA-binding protein|nr:DnaJ domain-containing protein [Candidatus Adiutrix sp.]